MINIIIRKSIEVKPLTKIQNRLIIDHIKTSNLTCKMMREKQSQDDSNESDPSSDISPDSKPKQITTSEYK